MPQTTPHLLKSNRRTPNYMLRFSILIVLTILCVLFSLGVGHYFISPFDVLTRLFDPVMPQVNDIEAYRQWSALFNIRIPRILAAFFVGAALATAGASYQGMFQNPLVSPDILGASAGAGFFAALAIISDMNSVMIAIFAFFGAILAVALAYLVSRLAKGNATLSLVLGGILVGSLFVAGTACIKYIADTEKQLPEIDYWLMGGFADIESTDIIFAAIGIAVGIVPLILIRWRMNVLTLGDDEARSIGVDTRRLRLATIFCSTLITAVAVSISGIIGWI
ncbi:MAG TPA: iron ABC transporter permease, partial [Methanocorpusculum sp.]|nr:iron ABC transporter permease [Methanocorpusculum sp.]